MPVRLHVFRIALGVAAALEFAQAVQGAEASPVVPVYHNDGSITAESLLPERDTRDILSPTTVNAANRDWVTHVLPTGRVVSPVGTVNGTPNFATSVVPLGEDRVAVLA
ncbi:MAG: hypothetical protein ACP5M3_05485, partial [Acidithiobacillus sp.]